MWPAEGWCAWAEGMYMPCCSCPFTSETSAYSPCTPASVLSIWYALVSLGVTWGGGA